MLSILFESGLPMIESLSVVAQGIGNRVVAGEVMKIAENFRRGREAMDRLEEGEVFPPLAVQMISVGLETGALGRMLAELAGHYDREVKYASRRLTNVLEPFLIFGLSGLVLVMALAVLLPMWNLIAVFKQ
jgi:type II secretory pathway component PulF